MLLVLKVTFGKKTQIKACEMEKFHLKSSLAFLISVVIKLIDINRNILSNKLWLPGKDNRLLSKFKMQQLDVCDCDLWQLWLTLVCGASGRNYMTAMNLKCAIIRCKCLKYLDLQIITYLEI